MNYNNKRSDEKLFDYKDYYNKYISIINEYYDYKFVKY